MKSVYKILLIVIACFSISSVQAQDKKTVKKEVGVTGVCGMCKARIEKAALEVSGVKMATWNATSQKLNVYFKTPKTDLTQIQEAIAKVGHDTESVKAKDEDYQKLPDCCSYRDGVEVH